MGHFSNRDLTDPAHRIPLLDRGEEKLWWSATGSEDGGGEKSQRAIDPPAINEAVAEEREAAQKGGSEGNGGLFGGPG